MAVIFRTIMLYIFAISPYNSSLSVIATISAFYVVTEIDDSLFWHTLKIQTKNGNDNPMFNGTEYISRYSRFLKQKFVFSKDKKILAWKNRQTNWQKLEDGLCITAPFHFKFKNNYRKLLNQFFNDEISSFEFIEKFDDLYRLGLVACIDYVENATNLEELNLLISTDSKLLEFVILITKILELSDNYKPCEEIKNLKIDYQNSLKQYYLKLFIE